MNSDFATKRCNVAIHDLRRYHHDGISNQAPALVHFLGYGETIHFRHLGIEQN